MTPTASRPYVQWHPALGRLVGLGHPEGLSPNERWILVAASAGAMRNSNILPSVRDLTVTTGLGKSTVYRALNRFRDIGLVLDDEDERGRFLRFRSDSESVLS